MGGARSRTTKWAATALVMTLAAACGGTSAGNPTPGTNSSAGPSATVAAAPGSSGAGTDLPVVVTVALGTAPAIPDVAQAGAAFVAPMDAFDFVAALAPELATYRDSVVASSAGQVPLLVSDIESTSPAPSPVARGGFGAGATAVLAAAHPPPDAAAATSADAKSISDYVMLGAVTTLLGQVFNQLITHPVDSGTVSGQETKTSGDSSTTTKMTVKLADSTGDSELALSLDTVVAKDSSGKTSLYRQGVGFGFKGRACPDAQGTVEFDAKVHLAGEAASGPSTNRDLTVHVTAMVDDNANVYDINTSLRQGTREHTADGRDIYVETTMSMPFAGEGGRIRPAVAGAPGKLVIQSQQATWSDVLRLNEAGMEAAQGFVMGAVYGAQAYWQSGGCIRIEATAPGKVDPGATTTIPVSVVHKLDGSQVPAKVTIALAGSESVSPATIAKAPGTVTHVAGAAGTKGTLTLTAVSKRGMATLDLTISAGSSGYLAAGGGPGMSTTGTVPDIAKPFTLDGVGQGFTVTFAYTPTSADGRSGTVTYTGGGGGFTMQGSGTYAITGAEGGPLKLEQTATGCVVGGGCRTTTEVMTLTPVASSGG